MGHDPLRHGRFIIIVDQRENSLYKAKKEDALRSVPINQLFGLSRTSLSLVVGQSKKLTVSNAKNVKWRSSDRTVASVSKNGVVKAKKAETATITAKTSGKNLRSRDECQTCDQKRTEIYRAV